MKVLSVQDISCYGQCSLTVALPILSSYGIETIILPSAILSTHTSGFKDFTVLDLTDEMPKIINHWTNENIKVNAIYTGYIGDVRQFEYILECKNKITELRKQCTHQKEDGSIVFTATLGNNMDAVELNPDITVNVKLGIAANVKAIIDLSELF